MNKYNSRIIIACDFNDKKELQYFLNKMPNKKLFLKLGMQILYKEGFGIIQEMKSLGHNIFVDLKVHDIPNTAKNAVKSLLSYQPDFLTVHTLGGKTMLEDIINETKNTSTNILGVTILTSHDKESLDMMNINASMKEEVEALMMMSKDAGLTHIVCSAEEANIAKKMGLISITPGIRLENGNAHDQIRIVTPSDAFKNGSDYIVMGRAIIQNADPLSIYESIETSIEEY